MAHGALCYCKQRDFAINFMVNRCRQCASFRRRTVIGYRLLVTSILILLVISAYDLGVVMQFGDPVNATVYLPGRLTFFFPVIISFVWYFFYVYPSDTSICVWSSNDICEYCKRD
jgi:hypothetical protein